MQAIFGTQILKAIVIITDLRHYRNSKSSTKFELISDRRAALVGVQYPLKALDVVGLVGRHQVGHRQHFGVVLVGFGLLCSSATIRFAFEK